MEQIIIPHIQLTDRNFLVLIFALIVDIAMIGLLSILGSWTLDIPKLPWFIAREESK